MKIKTPRVTPISKVVIRKKTHKLFSFIRDKTDLKIKHHEKIQCQIIIFQVTRRVLKSLVDGVVLKFCLTPFIYKYGSPSLLSIILKSRELVE